MEGILLVADVVALFLLLVWNVKDDNKPDNISSSGLFAYKEEKAQDSTSK